MRELNLSKGFRLECDGTTHGTKLYNHEGKEIGGLKELVIKFHKDKLHPAIFGYSRSPCRA